MTGLQVASYAGLVPPLPGWSVQFAYIYYSAEIGAARPTPIGGQVALNLEAETPFALATGIYIWDTGEGRWNFASAFTVPWAWVDVEADLVVGDVTVATTDEDSGMFDGTVVPVIASRHLSATRHLSFSLPIYAPTGDYEVGRLAVLSLNNWTFSPSVGYTELFQKGTLELSAVGAVEFYTENEDTDYQNGEIFRLDGLLIKRFANGLGIGAVGGWIEQLTDDEGDIADRLSGFQGSSLGLGPIVTYLRKWEGGQVEFSLRWLDEFEVENRFEGEPSMLTASIAF